MKAKGVRERSQRREKSEFSALNSAHMCEGSEISEAVTGPNFGHLLQVRIFYTLTRFQKDLTNVDFFDFDLLKRLGGGLTWGICGSIHLDLGSWISHFDLIL